jgi:alcohol dehydrogenase (cytochrome c)
MGARDIRVANEISSVRRAATDSLTPVRLSAVLLALLLSGCDRFNEAIRAVTSAASPVPDISNQELLTAQQDVGQWIHYSGNYRGTRYSPDTQINRENVGGLKLVWKYGAKWHQAGFETTAIAYDDRIYITVGGNELIRLDPAKGTPVWSFTAGPARSANRGAAVLGHRLYMGTADARLVCVDADSGLLLWDRIVDDARLGYRVTGAPMIVKDKVLVGVSANGARGFIDAYDASTGKRAWRFWVVPGPGEPGSETWEGNSMLTGGGSAWLTGTYDPELDLVYWGTGNPLPFFDGDARKGDNLYTNSIVALDPDTGNLAWHFQTTPHDLFDWDGVAEPILVDETINGRSVKAIVQANRNGYVFVLDRTNGELIYATPYTRVNWANAGPGGKPIIKPEIAGAKVRQVYPGVTGGSNWPPKAYSPRTHMLYIPSMVRGATYVSVPSLRVRDNVRTGGIIYWNKEPAEGSIEALDVRTGGIKWSFDTQGPNWGGLLATAGGLLFGGAFDGYLRAFNDETGEVLWEFQTGTGVYAPPTTFRIGGKQYIGLASGYGLMGNGSSGRDQQRHQAIYYLFSLEEH